MARDGLLPINLARVSSRGTPVRITIFTAIVVAIIAGLFPLADDRRAGQCRNADRVHRGVRGDAGDAPARARHAAQVHDARCRGWSGSLGILGCAYLFSACR